MRMLVRGKGHTIVCGRARTRRAVAQSLTATFAGAVDVVVVGGGGDDVVVVVAAVDMLWLQWLMFLSVSAFGAAGVAAAADVIAAGAGVGRRACCA